MNKFTLFSGLFVLLTTSAFASDEVVLYRGWGTACVTSRASDNAAVGGCAVVDSEIGTYEAGEAVDTHTSGGGLSMAGPVTLRIKLTWNLDSKRATFSEMMKAFGIPLIPSRKYTCTLE